MQHITAHLQTIALLIDEWADQRPQAFAVLAPGRPPLTYGQLREQVRSIVTTLNANGVGRDDRVAIVIPNGPELAVTFLGVAAGATSAPLNPAYRADEFRFYLSDLDVKALIVQQDSDSPVRAVAAALGIPLIELAPVPKAPAGTLILGAPATPTPTSRPAYAQPDDLALVLHTSGTTSRPKIVPLTQTNVCTSAHNVAASLALSCADRCLNIMPLFHVHGLVAAVLASLAVGGSVVCTPGLYAPDFLEWAAALQPTWYTAVPTMHQAILARARQQPRRAAQSGLRLIRSAS